MDENKNPSGNKYKGDNSIDNYNIDYIDPTDYEDDFDAKKKRINELEKNNKLLKIEVTNSLKEWEKNSNILFNYKFKIPDTSSGNYRIDPDNTIHFEDSNDPSIPKHKLDISNNITGNSELIKKMTEYAPTKPFSEWGENQKKQLATDTMDSIINEIKGKKINMNINPAVVDKHIDFLDKQRCAISNSDKETLIA